MDISHILALRASITTAYVTIVTIRGVGVLVGAANDIIAPNDIQRMPFNEEDTHRVSYVVLL